ncbi:MAG: sarcosine oxidase subunit gamma [Rhodobacter sp.]|nr:sarcosine oxidase subunit gamma [Rhodobacter sp.]MCY4167212.1 sarcosine oxidase subunit gamma [Rhodobacter sp.]MCY4241297.1 sarcosine oxidase subunit gamma [Rhodobacter sp.]
MSDLKPVTPLGGETARVDTIGGLTILENPDWALASLSARQDHDAEAAESAKDFLGFDLPEVGAMAVGDVFSAFWIGPRSWMVAASHDDHELLVAEMKIALKCAASVVEQTDGWCRFDVAGAAAFDLIERSCAASVRAMLAGQVVHTTIHHTGCFLIRDDGGWSVLGPRSSAGSLHHALVTAAHSVA